jgi:hypothetical protein
MFEIEEKEIGRQFSDAEINRKAQFDLTDIFTWVAGTRTRPPGSHSG